MVSLRDVARCVKVYRWFGEHLAASTTDAIQWTLEDFFSCKSAAREHVRMAVILSIAYCYHARLPRDERRQFCKHLEDAYKQLQAPLPSTVSQRPAGASNFFGFDLSPWYAERYGPRCQWLKIDSGGFNQACSSAGRAERPLSPGTARRLCARCRSSSWSR